MFFHGILDRGAKSSTRTQANLSNTWFACFQASTLHFSRPDAMNACQPWAPRALAGNPHIFKASCSFHAKVCKMVKQIIDEGEVLDSAHKFHTGSSETVWPPYHALGPSTSSGVYKGESANIDYLTLNDYLVPLRALHTANTFVFPAPGARLLWCPVPGDATQRSRGVKLASASHTPALMPLPGVFIPPSSLSWPKSGFK